MPLAKADSLIGDARSRIDDLHCWGLAREPPIQHTGEQ